MTTMAAREHGFTNVVPPHNARRAELAAFLRARRDELTPQRVGLPIRARRRTAGLRREEVAELAGISVALYTWLEQGRDVPVSERTIDGIAEALELSDGERCHLQRLAQRRTPVARAEFTADLRRMVQALHPSPVLVLNYAWDIVVANAAARAVFAAEPAAMSRDAAHSARNVLEYIFLDKRARGLFVEWNLVAQSMLETFRFEIAPYLDDARARTLVNRLHAASPAFASGWAQNRIRTHPDGLRSLAHPTLGTLLLEATLLTPNETPDFRLLMFAWADDETSAKIARPRPVAQKFDRLA